MSKGYIYSIDKWKDYSNKVKSRDGFKCTKCNRGKEDNIVLQAHNLNYIPSLLPWEYDLSHCITLCKGCHAREHDIIPPDSGWILVSIYDSGELDSNCYRPLDNKGKICGQAIRYIHTIYHPLYGYCDVGSECVQFLTEEDILIQTQFFMNIKI